MISEFIIGNYRGLRQLKLDELKAINIFVGPNNCGKTSILESIILSGLFDDVDLLIDTLISRYHGFSTEYFESFFPVGTEPIICLRSRLADEDRLLHTHITYRKSQMISKDSAANVTDSFELRFVYGYDGITESGKQDQFSVRFEEKQSSYNVTMAKSSKNVIDMHVPCKFISFSRFDRSERMINDIDKILDQNLRDELLDILKVFDDDIINFEIIGRSRTIKLFRKGQDQPLTLYDYGNGMYKAFFIATSALLAKNGILLVDEIEAGIHSKALTDFITKLINVCEKNNVQLFLTTHSLEAIDIILDDCRDKLDQTAIYHIKNKDNEAVAKRYGGSKLFNLRNEIGFDVR